MAGAVEVRGLKQFQRACKKSTAEVKKELPRRLKKVAEPVRTEAEQRAATIGNITPRWAGMRAGSKSASAVYIAPKARRAGGSPRPNLGRLLLRSMVDAREAKRDDIIREMEDMLDDLINGF